MVDPHITLATKSDIMSNYLKMTWCRIDIVSNCQIIISGFFLNLRKTGLPEMEETYKKFQVYYPALFVGISSCKGKGNVEGTRAQGRALKLCALSHWLTIAQEWRSEKVSRSAIDLSNAT